MRDDFRYHGFPDMEAAACQHRHPHAVAVEREHRVALRNEDGFLVAVGQKRVLAVGLAYEGAFEYLSLVVESVAVVAHLREHVVPRHLLHQVYGQHLQWVSVEFECFENLLEAEHFVRTRLEKVYQQLCHLALVEPLSAFLFLCHDAILL